jgi:hypothetical protein
MKKLFAAAALLTLTAPAYAGMVHIEPDDFIGGGPVTSPYAVLASIEEYVYNPVYARPLWGGMPAPTGQAVFDTEMIAEHDGTAQVRGFSIRFLVPVTEFWIGVINTSHPSGHNIEQNPRCWTTSGTYADCDIDYQPNEGQLGVPYFSRITSQLPIHEIILGASDMMGGLSFDRISFEVADPTEVPEPAPLATFAAGLAALAFLKRKKARA